MIPKIIHQFYIGQIPSDEEECSANLERMNPDWVVHRWTPDNIGPLINQRKYDDPRLYSHPDRFPVYRSNLVRAELIYNMGGVYVDYDWADSLPEIEEDYIIGHSGNNPDPAIIGCTPQHVLAAELIHQLWALSPSLYRRMAGCIALRNTLKVLDLKVTEGLWENQ